MRNIILNTWLLLIIILVAGFGSLCYSISSNDFSWFSRSGSVITIFGLLLTMKHHILSSSRDIDSIVMEKCHYANYAPDEGTPSYNENRKNAKIIMRDEYLGVFITITGTIIWGYGDLVYNLFI